MKAKIFLWLTFLMLSSSVNADDFVTLVSPAAGALQLTDEALMATKLRVKGHIDARDFQTLKRVTINRTRVLDLSEAVIETYKGYGCYADIGSDIFIRDIVIDYAANVLPQHAFVEARDNSLSKWREGSATLRELILPKTLLGISSGALQDCMMLTKVYTKEGSELYTEDDAIIYSKDRKHLLRVAPAYTGGLNIDAAVTTVDSCALESVKLGYIRFNSAKMPVLKGASLIDAAYMVAENVDECKALFPNIDCVEGIDAVEIENVQEGKLIEAIGNKGYTRKDVRKVKISGVLNDADIKSLFALPNLYYADLSKAATTAASVTLSGTKLVDVKLPSGNYYLSMNDNKYMSGSLDIPEGVYALNYINNGHSAVKFPSTLEYLGENSFKESLIEKADLSGCTRLTTLENVFSWCAHLRELLLPSSLETLKSVVYSSIEKITLPSSLKYWSYCTGWDIETVVLPESLVEIDGVRSMNLLKSIDANGATNLTKVVGDAFAKSPFIEVVDFSKSPIETFEAFNKKQISSGSVVVTGTTTFSPPCIASRLKKVLLPSTLKKFNAFNDTPLLTELKLDNCCNLSTLYGLENCTNLSSLSLPAELSKFNATLKGCESLSTIYIATLTPPTISNDTERERLSQVTLYVPTGKKGVYGMSNGWSDCKEIKEYGYTVTIDVDKVKGVVSGCGIYENGSEVTLTALPYKINNLVPANCVAWNVNGNRVEGSTVTFIVEENCVVSPIYLISKEGMELADICFEIEAKKDTVHDINLWSSSDIEIYSEDGLISKSSRGQLSLPLHSGVQRFAVLGDVSMIDLNYWNYESSNSFKNVILNNKEIITQLNLSNLHLDLNGIDLSGFSSLQILRLNNCNIKDINLSSCYRLQRLDLKGNELETLNLTPCPSLTYLDCSENNIGAIDLSLCSKLDHLYLDQNRLETLDLSNSSSLTFLSCGYNNLKAIDLSPCSKLDNLSLNGNKLETLDLSPCSLLIDLSCGDNNLKEIDLSPCSRLDYLYLNGNKLETLDLSCCSSITSLQCASNNLRELNLDGCYNLEGIYVWNNELMSLNIVSDKLTRIDWTNNPMAFTFLTPELYERLKQNGLGFYTREYKMLPSMVDEAGVLDLTHELCANEYSKDTKIEITQSNSWAEKISEGKFLLKSEQTWYRILFTNENFPGLSSDASFQLNKLTGIAAMDVDKLDITIGEKCVLVRGLGDGAEVELISLGGAVLQRAVFMNDEALLEVPDTENVCLLRIRKGNNTQTFKIKVN